jgi:tetratricopeptide (TPR) repeat protein
VARVFAKCLQAVAVTFAVCMASVQARQGAAVNPEAYANAIEAYANGRAVTEAVMALQLWTRKDFDAAVDRLIAARNIRQLEAAAVFELEVGLGVMSISPQGAQIRFELGERMLRSLTPTPVELRLEPGRAEDLRAFSSMWLGVAGSGYLWITDTRRAWPWIQKGLRLSPQSAVLRTLEGAAHEIDAGDYDSIVPRSGPGHANPYFEHQRRLELAHNAFRAATVADPQNAQAYIRMGRSLFLLDKLVEAREAFARGLALGKKPDDLYLGSLFVGAIQERQNDLTGARESYARALSIAPRSQTAIVALAHLELTSGRPDRAQALAQLFANAPADDHAWWAYKNGGLDYDGLSALRARVIR